MEKEEMMNIINSVQGNWSKDYIIRYLYVMLAPYFRRDLKYFLVDDDEKYKQFSQGFINRGRDIVCSTLADYYVELYQTFGINAKKVIANSAKIPLFAVIVEGDHGWFFMDILNDLFNNQYGLKTTDFGVIPRYKTLNTNYPYLEKLPKEYIDKIDDDLQLKSNLDDYISKLHVKLANRHSCQEFLKLETDSGIERFAKKMEFSSNELLNIGRVNGPLERLRIYWLIEKKLFFKIEKRNLKIWLNQDYQTPRVQIEYTDFQNNEKALFQEVKEDKKSLLKRLPE